MKMTIGNYLAILAVVGMAMPTQVIADVNDSNPRVVDIQLTASGDFLGMVVDDKGMPLANRPVQVVYGSKVIADIRTDKTGRYSVKGLRSGIHLVKTADSQQVCRFWPADSSPPAARRGLVLAAQGKVIRGQNEIIIGGAEEIVIGAPELLMMGAFSAVSIVTVTSATQDDNVSVGGGTPPASP